MGQWCYVNGDIIKSGDAKIWVDDRGLLYGDGLFETIRVYNGRPGYWEKHLQRLQRGAEFLDIPLPYPAAVLGEGARELLVREGITDGSLRLTLTRGRGKRGLYPAGRFTATLIMEAHHGPPYSAAQYAKGFRAVTVSFRRNRFSPLVQWKTLNFLEGILAIKEARKKGVEEGIWQNLEGEICEGTVSNLFIWSRETLITPAVECGLLPGIARGQVIKIAREAGIPVEERKVNLQELITADEAFLTNSLMEVMPLTEVNYQPIGTGYPGPLTQKISRLYRENILITLMG